MKYFWMQSTFSKRDLWCYSPIKSLTVLKSFRVLRLFKMFRYLASLRKIGEVLLSSFSSFMAIVLLMFIFMLVFAIVGLHVYGGIIPEDEFPNFNSFLNSIIVMFNVSVFSSSSLIWILWTIPFSVSLDAESSLNVAQEPKLPLSGPKARCHPQRKQTSHPFVLVFQAAPPKHSDQGTYIYTFLFSTSKPC